MSLNFILIIIFFEIGIFLLFLFLSTLFKKISQKFDTLFFKLVLFVTLNVWVGCGSFLYNTSKDLLDPSFWDPDTGDFLFLPFISVLTLINLALIVFIVILHIIYRIIEKDR
ncbi:hypothetical protein B9N66_05865 [Campylobacter concisus]|nr:hypothetical protein B9N66_05865 [Campylobacter concisus]